jgi:thiamine monophosphate synthase
LREETTHDPKCHTDGVVHLDERKILTSQVRKNVASGLELGVAIHVSNHHWWLHM